MHFLDSCKLVNLKTLIYINNIVENDKRTNFEAVEGDGSNDEEVAQTTLDHIKGKTNSLILDYL